MFPTDVSVKSIFSLNSQQDRPKCLAVPNACCQAVSPVNFFHHSTPLSHTFHGHQSVFCHNVCLLPLNHLVCWFSLFHSVCFLWLLAVYPSSFLTIFPTFSPILIYPFHSLALQPFLSYSSSITAPFSTLLSPFVLSSMTSFWLHVTRSFDISICHHHHLLHQIKMPRRKVRSQRSVIFAQGIKSLPSSNLTPCHLISPIIFTL